MAYAMMWPEAKRGGDRKSSFYEKLDNDNDGYSKPALSKARFILKHDSEKAALVRDGHPNFPTLYAHEGERDLSRERGSALSCFPRVCR